MKRMRLKREGKAERDFLFLENCCCKFFKSMCGSLFSMEQLGSSRPLAHKPLIGNMKDVKHLKASECFEDVVRASNTGMISYLMTFLIKGSDKDHSSHK